MLIVNGKILTWEKPNRILDAYAVLIRDGIIVEVAPQADLTARYPQEEKLDAGGQYVMPGNICAHTHFYGAYSRGMAIPGSPAKDFPEILEKLWWPLDKSLDDEAVKYSALVCMIDAIKHGTTTLIDHHASPYAIDGSLDLVAEAARETGLRCSLCYEVTDRDGEDRSKAGIRENVRFIRRVEQEKNPLLAATFGIHASLTVSDATLERCRAEIPSGYGFHIHVAEHSVDEYDSLAKTGKRVVDRLHQFGILGDRSIIVHAVHVDAKEIAYLAETKTWVSHQPRSNMNNAVGLPAVESMMRAGIKVCMGNDGFSNAMWEEWKTAYLAHKLWNLDPRRMGGYDLVEMAVYNNQQLAQTQFGGVPVGVIAPGAWADLIFVDYKPFTPFTGGNAPWHILFGFNESMITTTMVAGKVLMRDRKILVLDEAAVMEEALRIAPQVWERYNQKF
ncbi:putative aminohydrolase SsnA [Levilinea saccharolytica]|uniref:Hydrolase n=1 Tax=Levilinea saccharolytica TaxID=229921 RepID=A0A0P6XYM3_9CHLR|nr:putative aminohydrolase SsnA [Levilinea saccharolytica]KPL84987.1 hydrolase [Levilinea saccharolytica]GAP18081.1 putative selenium metabolism protein SsnA [Levilinea saccharolytica]